MSSVLYDLCTFMKAFDAAGTEARQWRPGFCSCEVNVFLVKAIVA